MEQPISDQIAAIILKREKNKAQLFEKLALQLRRKEVFFIDGESTPVNERIALESEIAHLEADRQKTKVELLQLKMLAKESREATFVSLLLGILKDHGLAHEIDRASCEAVDTLKHAGLIEAYKANV